MHIELERSRDLGYQRQPSPQMDRFRALGIDRAVENAELQDKLEKAQNELRRAQAELRLNQSDYERSQVEMEQMQEKVRTISKFRQSTSFMLVEFLFGPPSLSLEQGFIGIHIVLKEMRR